MKTKFYVMHYKKSAERRKRLEPILKTLDIDAHWYTGYDKDELTEEILSEYYNPDISIFRHRTAGLKTEDEYQQYDGISMGHISLCIKHIKCMEDLANSDYDNAVFFEDDITFLQGCSKDNIISSINVAEEIGWDALFLGGAFNHSLIEKRILKRYKNLLLVDHPATNTTSSFALTKKASKNILSTAKPICNSIDWELNYHFKRHNLNVWHTYPYLCGQLSTSGGCVSTL